MTTCRHPSGGKGGKLCLACANQAAQQAAAQLHQAGYPARASGGDVILTFATAQRLADAVTT